MFQTFIHRETGIYLSPAKKTLLVARLARRLRELGLTSFEAYYRRVVGRKNGDERVHLIDCICTNETHFFREPRQFEYIRQQLIPEWVSQAAAGRRNRDIRVWSAACSTGEEPYSIAMLLLKGLPAADGWRIELLASDLSTRVVEQARKGIWNLEKAQEIPAEYLTAFMMKGTRRNEGTMKATRQLVQSAGCASTLTMKRMMCQDPSI
jgi:chemotaxis protein methyltransferase CheR